MTYSLHEAKAKLSELVSLAESGATIEITRHGRVVATLSGTNFRPRSPGTGRASFRVIGDWELSDDEIQQYYEGAPAFGPTPDST